MLCRIFFFLIFLCSLVSVTNSAEALEVELWPETYFQLQQYRDVDKLRIDKTRFSQYLTLNIVESRDEGEPQHFFFSSLRVDFNAGKDTSIDQNENPLKSQRFALLYAYYEGRRLWKLVDVNFGRLVLSDELGINSFDGLKLTFRKNWYVGVEVYSGLEVKGALSEQVESFKFPNSDTHEPDGVIGNDHVGGIFGTSIFLDGFKDTEAKIQYRHRYSGETDSMDLSFLARHKLFDIWDLYSINSFSILFEKFSLLQFGTSVDLDWFAARIEHLSSRFIFAGDSIFNFFRANNEKELLLDLYFRPDEKTHLNLGYSRLLQNSESIFFDSWGHTGNASNVANLSMNRLLGAFTDFRFGYKYTGGWGGDYHRFALGLGSYLWNRRIRLEGDCMGTYYSRLLFTDILVGNQNKGFSWGLSGKIGFEMAEGVIFSIKADTYSNRIITRQFAIFSTLEIRKWLL